MRGRAELCAQEMPRSELGLQHVEVETPGQGFVPAAHAMDMTGQMRAVDPWLTEPADDADNAGFACHLGVHRRWS